MTKNKKINRIALACACGMVFNCGNQVWAKNVVPKAKPQTAQPSAPPQPKVMDFEGEVIEGKKKAPELFLNMEMQKLAPDSLIYERTDFNDFHIVDRTRRPRLTK